MEILINIEGKSRIKSLTIAGPTLMIKNSLMNYTLLNFSFYKEDFLANYQRLINMEELIIDNSLIDTSNSITNVVNCLNLCNNLLLKRLVVISTSGLKEIIFSPANKIEKVISRSNINLEKISIRNFNPESLTEIDFSENINFKIDIRNLQNLMNLSSLNLSGSKATGSLFYLRRLTRLSKLMIHNTNIILSFEYLNNRVRIINSRLFISNISENCYSVNKFLRTIAVSNKKEVFTVAWLKKSYPSLLENVEKINKEMIDFRQLKDKLCTVKLFLLSDEKAGNFSSAEVNKFLTIIDHGLIRWLEKSKNLPIEKKSDLVKELIEVPSPSYKSLLLF